MAKTKDSKTAQTCLATDCTKDASTGARGLCRECYSQARRAVKGGKTSWEKLEAAGLAVPSVRGSAGVPAWLSDVCDGPDSADSAP